MEQSGWTFDKAAKPWIFKESWQRVGPLLKTGAVVAGVLVTVWFFYPGCFSGDPKFSWLEAINKPNLKYHNWHPPFVAYLWHLLNEIPITIVPRSANLFLFMVLLFWVGIVLLAERWANQKVYWLVFVSCVGLFPPVFAILSQPIKDSLMCSALVAACGGLVVAELRRSYVAFSFALLCIFLAMQFRHNAAFAIMPLSLWAILIFCERLAPSRMATLASNWGFKIGAWIVLLCSLISSTLLLNRSLTEAETYPIQQIYTFDLVGMSAKANKIYLPKLFDNYTKPSSLRSFWTPKGNDIQESPLTLDNIKQHLYRPESGSPIYWWGQGKGLRFLDNAEEVGELQSAWIDAIRTDFTTYLQVRTDLFLRLLTLRNVQSWPYYCMYELNEAPEADSIRMPQYYLEYRNSILYMGYFYVAAVSLAFIFVLLKPRFFPRNLLFLGLSGLLYVAVYLFISPESNFRLLFWLVMVSALMAIEMAFLVIRSILSRWI